MNYIRIYKRIIDRARNRSLAEDVYVEKHHIIPRCLGGSDDDWNIICLTPEEHYLSHQLLVKMCPENQGLVHAACMMTVNSEEKDQQRGNKLYGWLKQRWINGLYKETVLYDHKILKYITFSSRTEASLHTKVLNGDISALLSGRLQSVKKGRYTRSKDDKSSRLFDIRFYDTYHNEYITFNSLREAATHIGVCSGDLSLLRKGIIKSVNKKRYTL